MSAPLIMTLESSVRFRSLAVVSAVAACVVPLPAQTSPAGDDTITLSDFVVTAKTPENYMPAEQTSGTRYATKLMEVPFSVQAVTSEFLNDFRVLDFNDALGYTSGFSDSAGSLGGTGAIVLRGVRSFSNYKDGVLGGYLFGSASIDRIEVVKGTNASLYGQTSPTGMVNNISKTAMLDQAKYVASTSAGSDHYQRLAFDASVPVIPRKLAVRVAATYENSEQNAQDFYYLRRLNVYGTVSYRLGDNTDIKVNLDYIKSKQEAGLTAASVLNASGKVIGILGVGAYKRYYSFNPAGPNSYNPIEDTTSSVSISHRFSDVFSMRVFGAHDQRHQNQFRIMGGSTFNSATNLFNARTARIYPGEIASDSAKVDLLAQFSTGPVKHKLMLTFDYLDSYQTSEQYTRSTALPTLNIDSPVYYNFAETYFVRDYTIFNQKNANTWTDAITTGGFVSERASLWRSRLIAMAGVRYDTVDTYVINRLVANGGTTKTSVSQPTYQTGLLYKVTPETISLYASYSESFTPQTKMIYDYDGNPFPNALGKGYDAGIKASVLDKKLNFTLGVFGVSITNQPLVATDAQGTQLKDPHGASYYVGGSQSSHGVEFDCNWIVTENLGLLGSYAYVDARWTAVQDLKLLNVAPANNPHNLASLVARYSLAGWGLKGLSARIGARYRGAALMSSTIRDLNGNLFYSPDYIQVDGGAAYEWRVRHSKLRHRLDLNLKNLFDEKVIVSLGQIDRFMAMGSYTLSY